ncbi:MAG TPA: pyridoxal-phosphate dependent enzyme [Solirubrobacteraceae bacterium]|nr:pyridoxal-phosphate dependent enzyme [Solirubrobacteraceae bacterium]
MIPADLAIAVDDVQRAAERLTGVAHRTPVLTSSTLNGRVGAQVFLKSETFQRMGAFKFRGAYNAVSSLTADELERGVCAVSSGNHAQAVTLAARLCGTRAVILMPDDAPALKRAATEGYGAEVVEYERYGEDREDLVHQLAAERGMVLVHPFDNPLVMAGQGTLALELLRDVDVLDVLLVPVGGGGLISGCATACAALSPRTRVIGVEPEAGDDVARSLASGERVRIQVGRTIADGQQAATPGELTWPIIKALAADVVTVTDAQIVAAMRFLFERMKLVVEPSGASAFAALLAGGLDVQGQRVGVVLSGGNIGADAFGALLASGS